MTVFVGLRQSYFDFLLITLGNKIICTKQHGILRRWAIWTPPKNVEWTQLLEMGQHLQRFTTKTWRYIRFSGMSVAISNHTCFNNHLYWCSVLWILNTICTSLISVHGNTCEDSAIWCDVWSELCHDVRYRPKMYMHCRKTCELCNYQCKYINIKYDLL